MAKVYEFLADGFEEIEGLAPVDILRRGGVDIKTVSITGNDFVETSHGVTIKADLKFEDIHNFDDADMMLLPGGMPGSTNLNNHDLLKKALLEQIFQNAKYVFDVIYNQQTPFLTMAQRFNIPTKDGKEMLLYQAVLAFNLFFKNQYDFKKIENVMNEAFKY